MKQDSIDFMVRGLNGDEVKEIDSMKELIRIIYKELQKNRHGDDFSWWVLSEKSNPSEVHSAFTNEFINTAFGVLDENDWDLEKAFKKQHKPKQMKKED